MDSKQRAALRAQANGLDTIAVVGKGGVNQSVTASVDAALKARELIKCRALETGPDTAAVCAQTLADALNADVIQVIGTRFVLYRYNPELHKPKPVPVSASKAKTGAVGRKPAPSGWRSRKRP